MSSPDAGPHIQRLPGVGSSLDLTDADGHPLRLAVISPLLASRSSWAGRIIPARLFPATAPQP